MPEANEHPPIANKVVCVDFDGTIIPWGPLMERREPYPGVTEALVRLNDAGYRIVIFTSRLSDEWLTAENRNRVEQFNYVYDTLKMADIPWYDMTSEKVPAEAYFDDKAIAVGPGKLPLLIDAFLLGASVTTGITYDAHDTDETRVTDASGGQKGTKLTQLGAIDPLALIELARVSGHGANKYDAFNYLKGYDYSLSFNAAQRHALLFWSGEDIDPDSGRSHAAMAAWHMLAMFSFIARSVGNDDRPPRVA